MGKLGRWLFWTVLFVVVVGGICRAAFLDTWTVPDELPLSSSVAPSLQGGDFILLLTRGTPGFGDLVRCEDPENAQKFVVGRIVGLSSDVIESRGLDLSVNNKRFNSTTSCAEPFVTVLHPVSGAPVQLHCDRVDLGGREHYRGWSDKATIFTTTKITVGPGMAFLLSDDRSYHDDSRDFGVVPLDSCKERVFFRVVGKEGLGDARSRFTYVR
jgi:signal peptidase I